MADITFNGLTFNGEFTPPSATPGDYELMWISCPAGATRRAMVDHEFMGIDGIESVDGGARPREFTMGGLIVAADAQGCAAAEEAIYAAQDGAAYTLGRWGVDIDGVELLEFKPGGFQTGQYCYENFAITFRQL
jgi:hypothetical protein